MLSASMVGQYTFCHSMNKRKLGARDPAPRTYLKADLKRGTRLPERAIEKAMLELGITSPFTEGEVYALLVCAHRIYGKTLERIYRRG